MGLIILIGIGFLIFNLITGEEVTVPPEDQEEEEQPDEEMPEEVEPPEAFITPDFIQELIVPNTREATLENALSQVKADSYPETSITYLPIRLSGVTVEGQPQFLSAETFFSGLNITPGDTPETVYQNLEPTFMLYVYGSGEEERVACQNNLVTEEECHGPRLGAVLKAREGTDTDLESIAQTWMDQIENSGLEKLVLNDLATMPEGDPVFQTVEYQSDAVSEAEAVQIHFLNLPMPAYDNLQLSGTSLDFAVVNDFLVVATSKNSLLRMVDRILSETQAPETATTTPQ